jgi:hypothetical protein
MESRPGLSILVFSRCLHANRPPPDEAGYGRRRPVSTSRENALAALSVSLSAGAGLVSRRWASGSPSQQPPRCVFAGRVEVGGKDVGVGISRCYSYAFRVILSLCVIDVTIGRPRQRG